MLPRIKYKALRKVQDNHFSPTYPTSISGVWNQNNEFFSVGKKLTCNNVSSLLAKPSLLTTLTAQLLSQVPGPHSTAVQLESRTILCITNYNPIGIDGLLVLMQPCLCVQGYKNSHEWEKVLDQSPGFKARAPTSTRGRTSAGHLIAQSPFRHIYNELKIATSCGVYISKSNI